MQPYAPPGSFGRPAVIGWLRAYAKLGLLTYLLVFGVALFDAKTSGPGPPGSFEAFVTIAVISFLFAALYGVAVFAPYRPWGWTWCLVAICVGLASCLVPFAIPLLIFWLKPETKAAFGRV